MAGDLAEEWPSETWWRGHASEGFTLQPGIHRADRGGRAEQNLSLRFRQQAPSRQANCPEQDDFVAWLFLMQHYGLPTRLLDWTASVLVALFFATSERSDEGAHLYALNPRELNRVVTADATLVPPTSSPARELFVGAFNDRVQEEATISVMAHEIDKRMLAQQSTFTIHGSSQALDAHPDSARFLRVFNVPAAAKQTITAQLDSIGLRRSTLFPDLENLAADLKGLTFPGIDA
ncbi:MAG: FRG domain-containing protein [Coriobacteriia bacterium]|nr:FRG domain-containing protein [Coriobacteriia bacterium]